MRHLPESNPYSYGERMLMVKAAARDLGLDQERVARDPVPRQRAGALGRVRAGGDHAVPAALLGLGRREAGAFAGRRLRGGDPRRGCREGALGRGGARGVPHGRRLGAARAAGCGRRAPAARPNPCRAPLKSVPPTSSPTAIRSEEDSRTHGCQAWRRKRDRFRSSLRRHASDLRRPPRRARRPRARLARRPHRERGRRHAEPRPARRERLLRPHLRRRARPRALERDRPLGDARLHAGGVPGSRRVRGGRAPGRRSIPSTSSPSRPCGRPSGAPTGSGSTGRLRKGGEDEDDAAELVAACAALEVDGFRFELTHVRRGEAILRVFPDADDRVTDSDAFFKDRYPVLRPQATGPRGRADGPGGGGLDEADDRAPR